MTALSPVAAIILGVVLALWLGAAIWALMSGQRMRREGTHSQGRLDRLTVLLASAPAAPVIVHPDGRLEAADRLAKWLGKSRAPNFLSELTAEDGGIEPEDGQALAREIAAAQRAGKSFALPIRGLGSTRLLLVRGAPAGLSSSSPPSIDTTVAWLGRSPASRVRRPRRSAARNSGNG